MADATKTESLDSAEKAYAAAAEAVTPKADPAAEAGETEVVAPEPVAAEPALVIPALKPAKAPKPKAEAKPAPAPVAETKSEPVKPVAKVAPKAKKPKGAAKPVKAAAPKALVTKPAKITPAKTSKPLPAVATAKIKDTIMTAKTKTTDFSAKIKDAFADVQGKAKLAYGKGAAAVAEAGEFTKGNVEAVVASGKILADGFKGLGTDYVAESKKAYETLTADLKDLTAVKSPTEFFQLQAKIARRNFDSAIALTSKNTETTVKLFNDAFAPISTRVSLAVEKVKKAA